ncbi:MAG: VCBS repeat-containing protein [Deltaproteobacteria bacterium]|nr:VCBS repeat-containing protein [Deltaproteobacteria bacterium]
MGSLIKPWVLALATTACTELPARPADVCGNGVVESPREDCDTTSDSVLGDDLACAPAGDPLRECRYVCDAGGPSCPLGWSCDRDGLCHYPSGRFGVIDTLPFNAEFLRTGDLDGNGRQDLVGIRADRVSVRFGSDDGLSEPYVFAISLAGIPSIADVDADGLDDVVAPMFGGQLSVLLGESNRSLVPVPYASLEPAGATRFQLKPIRTRTTHPADGFVFFFEEPGGAYLTIRDFDDASGAGTAYRVASSLDEIAGRVPIGDLDGDGDEELVLAIHGSPVVSVLHPRCAGSCAPVEVTAEALTFPGAIDSGVQLGDVDGDGTLDLIADVGDRTAVALGDGSGSFGLPAIEARFDALLYIDIYPIRPELATRWPVAAGDLDADGRADFVSPFGVYVSSSGGLTHRGTNVSSLEWTEAVVTDLNRDGHADVAAISADFPGVDLMLGDGAGRFSLGRVETDALVRSLRTGDFDGDRVGDLALVIGSGPDEQAAVVFGTLEGPLAPPVSMGRLGGTISDFESAKLYSGPFFFDVTDDLIVTTSSQSQSIAFLTGARERRMLSPLILGVPDEALGSSLAVVTGRFDPGRAAEREPDVAVLDALGATLVQGAAEARFDTLRRLEGTELGCFAGLDPICTLLGTAELDGDAAAAELVLVSGASDCGEGPTELRVAGSVFGGAPRCSKLSFPPDLRSPSRLAFEDLDRDGGRDLVIPFSDKLAIARDFAIPGEARAIGFSSIIDIAGLVDAVALNADRDEGLEIAALTEESIVIVDAERGTLERVLDLESAGRWFRIIALDVDSDKLLDLVISDGSEVRIVGSVPSGVAE